MVRMGEKTDLSVHQQSGGGGVARGVAGGHLLVLAARVEGALVTVQGVGGEGLVQGIGGGWLV